MCVISARQLGGNSLCVFPQWLIHDGLVHADLPVSEAPALSIHSDPHPVSDGRWKYSQIHKINEEEKQKQERIYGSPAPLGGACLYRVDVCTPTHSDVIRRMWQYDRGFSEGPAFIRCHRDWVTPTDESHVSIISCERWNVCPSVPVKDMNRPLLYSADVSHSSGSAQKHLFKNWNSIKPKPYEIKLISDQMITTVEA